MTPNEAKLLQAIVNSEFHDGYEIVNNPVWSDFGDLREIGTFGSLVKKGFAGTNNEKDPKEQTCWITRLGYDKLLEHNNKWTRR